MSKSPILCPYCRRRAALVQGTVIYPHRPDLATNHFWHCAPCKAWVSCHRGTRKPLGRLADAELRRAKIAAHAAFDPLWKTRGMDRRDAYAWLAGALGIPEVRRCHIGHMDIEQCQAVVAAVAARQQQGVVQ